MDSKLIKSPLGTLRVEATDKGIRSLEFVTSRVTSQKKASDNRHIRNLENELRKYFDGQSCEFRVPLDVDGTDFQKRAWKQLRKIPTGKTISYAEQARRVGNVRAVRAVAQANGRNPIAIIVPCHRVIGKDGSLTGYAAGIDKKKWLLEHEIKFFAPGEHSIN